MLFTIMEFKHLENIRKFDVGVNFVPTSAMRNLINEVEDFCIQLK